MHDACMRSSSDDENFPEGLSRQKNSPHSEMDGDTGNQGANFDHALLLLCVNIWTTLVLCSTDSDVSCSRFVTKEGSLDLMAPAKLCSAKVFSMR
jgi:hypothetical protein